MKTIGRVMQLFSVHYLMTLYKLSVPSFKKISPTVSELLSGHILKFTKGHNSIKDVGGVTVLVLGTSPDNVLYLGSTLGWSQSRKGHNSVKTVNGVMVLDLCTSSDNALYFKKISQRVSELLRGCGSVKLPKQTTSAILSKRIANQFLLMLIKMHVLTAT